MGYLVFGGSSYYPEGGAADYLGVADDEESGKALWDAWKEADTQYIHDGWMQLVSLHDGSVRELYWSEEDGWRDSDHKYEALPIRVGYFVPPASAEKGGE